MNLDDALGKAVQILNEEQVRPTVSYSATEDSPNSINWPQLVETMLLTTTERQQRPRRVHENPKSFTFKSTNFDLLLKIFGQVPSAERTDFIARLLTLVRNPPAASLPRGPVTFPIFEGRTSALPLIAEFSVRTGHLNELLDATRVPETPSASLAVMLQQFEEMIALNFNLFSEAELINIPTGLAHLRKIAEEHARRTGYDSVGGEIVSSINGITAECQQAGYWYLKGALQELPNLQIEADKRKVENFLVKLGFTHDMVQALNEAEREYSTTATPFELKNCLGHLRSFLEHLHRRAAKSIASTAGTQVTDRWSYATIFLRQRDYFTKEHEAFVTSLYALVSDESVHALGAEREYARLLRSVVIEYGVMFLTTLDKRGVRIT